MNAVQLQAKIQRLIPLRDAATGVTKREYRKEINLLEHELAKGRAMTALDMGRALYQSDVPHAMTVNECADIASYFGRVLIGRNLMLGRTVRLDLENGHHVVCTLEKI